jgi:hypothetical protein
MNKRMLLSALAIAALLVSLVPAYGQGPQAPPQPPTPGQIPPGQIPATRVFTGELTKVDTSSKIITAKGADSKEMSFIYNESTVVVGGDKTVQGLTGKAGTDLRINYREERGNNLATRIEIMEERK